MAKAMCALVAFVLAGAVLSQANQCTIGSECPSDIKPSNVASLLGTQVQLGVSKDGGKDNHCSSGGECPSDDRSGVVTLLQTKLRMNVLEVGGGEKDVMQQAYPREQACNWDCYLARYPDLRNAFGNNQGAASRHYANHGKAEGRDCTCSQACNWDCYLARYPDLQNAFGNNQGAASRHYMNHGKAEGRDCTCSEACNWDCYVARYPDLQEAFGIDPGAASHHYTNHGKAEGRDCTCSETCNWDCYLARYPDLQKAFGNDQGAANRHYTDHGKAEGRDCTCSEAPTTEPPTTEAPTTDAPTTEAPTTEAPTTEAPTTEAPTTEAPTTEAPTTEGRDLYTFGEKGMLDGCPLGYSGIFGATVCKQAADDLGYYMRSGTSKHGNAYPGCYFYESSKMAYFNTHPDPDGTWHTANAGQICMLEAATAAPSP